YWGKNISVTVSDRPTLELEVTPEKIVARKQVVLKVLSRGVPVGGAKVVVTKPDSSVKSFVSSESGQVYFTEATDVGEYSITVEKTRYEPYTQTLEARNEFTVNLMPDKPRVGETITFIVKDQLGKAVSNANVNVVGANISSRTTGEGEAKITLPERRDYKVKILKNEFWDETIALSPYGSMNLELESNEVEVGKNISIVASDTANIDVTLPDGSTQSFTDVKEIEFETSNVGTHKVQASKPDFVSSEEEFEVKPHPVNLSFSVEEEEIVIIAKSHGEAVEDLALIIHTPEKKQIERETNSQGKVSIGIAVDGIYTIEVNPRSINPDYERKTLAEEAYKSRNYILLFVIYIVIIIAAGILISLVVFIHKHQRRRTLDDDKPVISRSKSSFSGKRPKRKSSLGRK
ncbi:hypothetical protein ACFLRC_05210, partial [Candidatus Altiarchaeota archaeon]